MARNFSLVIGDRIDEAATAAARATNKKAPAVLIPTTHEEVLHGAAEHYAVFFSLPSRMNKSGTRYLQGPDYVMQDFYNFHYKDEWEVMRDLMSQYMGSAPYKKFAEWGDKHFTPREDSVFHGLLKERLAITPDGDHIEGVKGTSIVTNRPLGHHYIEVETPESIITRRLLKKMGMPDIPRQTKMRLATKSWVVYAGEEEERERIQYNARTYDSDEKNPSRIDELEWGQVTMALNPNFSAEWALAGIDGARVVMDEGTAAGYLQGRTGAQPADPDAITGGTLLFSCEGNITNFFNAGADDADGTVSTTAQAISDDTSADNTNTLTYVRGSSANSSITELDNHIDGEAGTGTADFVFNTVSIVSGSTVSITSMVVGQSQGATAT